MAYQAAETRAGVLFNALDAPFTLPNVDLSGASYTLPSESGNPFYAVIDKIELESLTQGSVGGTGAFEILMQSLSGHLKLEYDKGRITGDQYAKAYIELTGLAMQTAMGFVMGKEQAYWQAMLAREQGKKAEVEVVQSAVNLEIAKAQLAMTRAQAEVTQAQLVLVKMQLATEDAKFELTWEQTALTDQQRLLAVEQTAAQVKQVALLDKQILQTEAQTIMIGAQTDVQEKQLLVMDEQIALTGEQAQVAHAQWSDTIIGSGTAVSGMVLKQKDLLVKQAEAFDRDADARIAKMMIDTWIVQRTTNEAETIPASLDDANINEVVNKVRVRANLNVV